MSAKTLVKNAVDQSEKDKAEMRAVAKWLNDGLEHMLMNYGEMLQATWRTVSKQETKP